MTASLHGILIIDKPAGWTSHDVVGWVRKWAGERKVGHAGTLDPAATGVLPVALNDGTRVLEFLGDETKSYVAEITFGVETDSGDADGQVIATRDTTFSRSDLERALGAYRGLISQRPPAHSAIRIEGRRAYELVRSGKAIEVPERTVTIHELSVLGWADGVLTLFIDCSKGTYIRSIARDLGNDLGSGAYLSNLVRTRAGPYCLDDAWTLKELAAIDPREEWPWVAHHPDSAVHDWPAIVMSESQARDWQFGRPVFSSRNGVPTRARVYDNIGHWCGLAKNDPVENVWRALRVIKPL